MKADVGGKQAGFRRYLTRWFGAAVAGTFEGWAHKTVNTVQPATT